MPWNDTAQLDYLNPEVREAVIQTILEVARRFPVIRFDAAMTLAKKHYQRLWFPEPGTGGAIPSRAEHGLTRNQLDELMPEEFWREVVDRVAQEVPDTLLLAEAFWLMEGYFVRTLGMHRVYNSAFMNMLRDEENANYRSVMKNTLEFDPEILKRYVNFMNNPDERTAVDQFGKDDKYFGVCLMMVTLPGLPMFGHGQIQGFTEKYGMEYRRAYWDEQPDAHLIERHQREIFPVLRHRYLFAQVENFLLYDFFSPEGYVNEDVYAYSNRTGDESALVVYHNRFASAAGWIKRSVGYSVKSGDGEERTIVQKDLAQGLALNTGVDDFVIFRDQISGLEFIHSGRELAERGLYVELGAYKYNVFLDFRQVQDSPDHPYAHLHAYLNGRGVPSIEEALTEILLQPVHQAFSTLVNPDMLNRLLQACLDTDATQPDSALLDELEVDIRNLLARVVEYVGDAPDGQAEATARLLRSELAAILSLPVLERRCPDLDDKEVETATGYLRQQLEHPSNWAVLLGWLFVHALGQAVDEEQDAQLSRSWIDEWLLGKILATALAPALKNEEQAAWQVVALVKILTSYQDWCCAPAAGQAVSARQSAFLLLQNLLSDSDVQQFLQINRYQDVLWFNQEAFEQLLSGLFLQAVVSLCAAQERTQTELTAAVSRCFAIIQALDEAKGRSEYRIEDLLDYLRT
jgi:hypothetical protein